MKGHAVLNPDDHIPPPVPDLLRAAAGLLETALDAADRGLLTVSPDGHGGADLHIRGLHAPAHTARHTAAYHREEDARLAALMGSGVAACLIRMLYANADQVEAGSDPDPSLVAASISIANSAFGTPNWPTSWLMSGVAT